MPILLNFFDILMQKRGKCTYNLITSSQILLVVFIGYLLTVTLDTSFFYIIIFNSLWKISKIPLSMIYFVMEKFLINRMQEYWRYCHLNLNFKNSSKLIFMNRMYFSMYEMGLYLYGHCLISNSNPRTQNIEYFK